MPDYTTADIRTITLVGPAGGGKTTLVDRLLHGAGAIGRPGSIEEKNTVCDYEAEEKEHGHSLSSALVHFTADGKRINLIDTPGYPDFVGQAIASLPAAETAAIVIDAGKGVEPMARRMKKLADERRLASMLIVNKMEHAEDLELLVENIRETLGSDCLPINLPAEGGKKIVDVFEHESGEADFSSVADAHTAIIDQVVEVDDELMEQYLAGESLDHDRVHAAFEKALREAHLTPICFCSATGDVGVQELLRVFTRYCPNPQEGNPRPFHLRKEGGEHESWTPDPDPSKPLLAHAFKISTDPFVGKLAYLRIHQGTLKHNSQVFRNDQKKAVRVGHLLHVVGKEHGDVDEAIAGDIVAVPKIEDLHVNDCLHDSHDLDGVEFEPPALPRPMFGLAITPHSRGDETKMGAATQKLMEEDPTFVVERVTATNQTVARGVGELHLRIMMEKLKNHFGVEVDTEPPRVAYKETITAKAEGHHRHKKQSGGAGQFGEVFLRVEPLPADSENGFEFVDDTFGGSIPRQFLPAIEKGIRQVLDQGAVAGYPLTGVRVSVYDGKHHPVDSKEVAFMTAGKRAFIDAVKKANPVLLEPYVELEVTAPSDALGDLTGDLSGKRGRVQGTDMLPGGQVSLKAVAPLAETLNYASQLKSMTAGQGTYTMDYSHDERTPPNVQQEIVERFQPKEEED